MKKKKKFQEKPIFWIGTLYFAEGFPYTIIRIISSIFFRVANVSLENIGLTSLYGLPWTLKFLWGPYVDKFSTNRNWLLSTQGMLSIMMLIVAILSPIESALATIGVIFFIGSIIAATHDIAIDGYYMKALSDKEQEKFVGYRILAYRISMIFGTGVIVTLGTSFDSILSSITFKHINISSSLNWPIAFLTSGIVFSFLTLYHYKFLPKKEKKINSVKELIPLFKNLLVIPAIKNKKLKPILVVYTTIGLVISLKYFLKTSFYVDLGKEFWIFKKLSYAKWIGILILLSMIILILYKKKLKSKLIKNKDSFYAKSFLSFIDREKIGYAIAFIILVRTGEFMLHAMTGSFMVDLGLKDHIGWIVAGVGLPASIVGALLGGWLISKYGFKKMVFPLLLIQNLTNLLYMWIAYHLNSFIEISKPTSNLVDIGGQNLFFVAFVNGFEQFSAGLGTAVLTIYLLNLCIKEFKTAHFALGTGLMSVSGVIAGILGGIIAQDYGYTLFFLISFLVAIPSMILLFVIPDYKDDKNKEEVKQ